MACRFQRRVSQLMTPRLSVRTTIRQAGSVPIRRRMARSASRTALSSSRLLVVAGSAPAASSTPPSGHSSRNAHAPGPGLPEQAPSV